MREAMANACVGDEQSDDDPTTLELCEQVAALLGFDAGVFMPSGTMCNLVGILALTRPGDEMICDRESHIYGTEAAGAAAIAGISIRAIDSPHGIFTAQQVADAVRQRTRTAPRTTLLSVEQTTNFSGGAIWPLKTLRAARDMARSFDMKCHLDGARLFNACAATGIAPAEYAAGWDSAWIDLSKGLGCPVGAVLCGDRDFVREAWQWKYRLGGAMRQSGVLAAAGIYALEHHLPLLAQDHQNTQTIWETLLTCGLFRFDPARPASNILRFTFASDSLDAGMFARQCLERGVRVRDIGGNYIRVTTHLDVTADDAATAANTMVEVARDLTRLSASS
ncbi:aromatic amino acid beta-eliminating lyase/threonine aldolase [Paraburkholderia hospita]|uniref:Aromatic amino acid beta-eliminating lyase/threonine aldolase n=2 Tax=Paraburkholderia hospita TaxID=169430 RepID=A0ABN0FTN2_9BURK|nr:aromatic amino acid beta-eliminating lyase/threonine aldolase [Paraburkholderia hospita]